MTNKQLQQELLAKVKEGIKPSEIKKQSQKQPKKPISPPPMEITKSDEGYSSDEATKSHESPVKNQGETFIKDLQSQVQALQKQLQLYKDFREGDMKVKEDLKKSLWALNKDQEKYKETISQLKQSNDDLIKTVEYLQNQFALGNQNNKPEPNEPTEIKTFTCSECQQTKPQDQLSRAFHNCSFCLECSKQARLTATQQKSQIEEFICHLCKRGKKAIPVRMKLDQTLTEYLVCQACRPLAKEFNEADLITDELWNKYPYSSASEILEKEFGIKPKN